MNDKTLRKLQLTEVEILKEALRIIEKHRFEYYLFGGTLLGAARHQGFIPWDDDLDIAMPRREYERFVEVCKVELNESFMIHCERTDPTYWLPYAKIRKKNTLFVEPAIENIKAERGIFIDIIPLDPERKQAGFGLKKQAFLLVQMHRIIVLKRGLKLKGRFGGVAKIAKVALWPFPIALFINARQRLMKRYLGKGYDYYADLCTPTELDRRVFPKSDFSPHRTLLFEGIRANVPAKYEKILTQVYGDYMQLPPVDQRRTHTPVQIDFGSSLSATCANRPQ